MSERKQEVGRISHYYPKIGVAVVELKSDLSVGDTIEIKGTTTGFEQVVESMQIEHKNIDKAGAGQAIGLKTKEKVREGDIVYK